MTIPAEAHSDDRIFEANFDALPYFEQADDEDLYDLVECGYGGNYAADLVAIHIAQTDSAVNKIFEYLALGPKMGRDPVGFECHVNQAAAEAWIKENRPQLYNRLIEEAFI